MKKVLKIFGLPRSGTNLMELLLPLNFCVDTCQKREFNDHLGWKHARPLPINNYNTLGQVLQEQYYFIFSYRNKEEWVAAMEKHWGSFEMPWEFKNSEHFIFNTPMGPEIYESIEQYYDAQIQAYQNFYQSNPANTLLVNYSEFKNDQIKLLDLIESKFHFPKAQTEWTTINKKINWYGQIVNEIA